MEDNYCGDAGGGFLSFDLVLSTVCEMNSLQDLTWGTEKTEQLVFALDIGTTSSEFGEPARVSQTHSGQRRCLLLSPNPWEKSGDHYRPPMEGAGGAVW